MNKTLILLILLVLAATALLPGPAFAADKKGKQDVYSTRLINPIKGTAKEPAGQANLLIILGTITKRALTVLGSLTLLVFVYGGALWILAAGNEERIKKGTQTMIWAVVGLFIIFGSYAILSTILSALTGKTISAPGSATSTETAILAEGCQCSFKVQGTGCNVNKTATFAFGQNVTVQSLIDMVSLSECLQKVLLAALIDTSQSLTVTKEQCASVKYSGSQSGYTWSVSCQAQEGSK